ncbi:MAG: ABC transporter permease [Bacilli bacterium]|jgi:hypothetical protein|nr:ABC transporter permease [Bacilli bacterium]
MIFDGWKGKIAKSYLRDDMIKNIILFCSTLISFSSLLLATGFYYGAIQVVENAQKNIIDSSLFKAVKKESVSNNSSPLSLVKLSRPSREDLGFVDTNISSAIITNDYSKLFPGSHSLYFNEKRIDSALFSPVYSYHHLQEKSSLLVQGSIPREEDLEKVAINKTFALSIADETKNLIGEKITLEIETKIAINDSFGTIINDLFMLSIELEISGIFEELAFLNTSKIFYSHIALENVLEDKHLEDLSNHFNTDITCQNIFSLIDDNHYLTNYGLNVFVLDNNEVESIATLSETLQKSESMISLESSAIMIQNTYQELTEAAFYSMLIFIVIAFFGTGSIMAIGSYSNYVSKKKESAILTCLGANKKCIFDIFFYETMLITVSASIASLAIAYSIQILANNFFYKHYMFKNLIAIPYSSILNIPFFIIFVVLTLVYICTLIFTYLPLRFYKGLSLADELREN